MKRPAAEWNILSKNVVMSQTLLAFSNHEAVKTKENMALHQVLLAVC